LAEGEEAITSERLARHGIKDSNYDLKLRDYWNFEGSKVKVLRPWKHGWIVRRIPEQAQPAPGPVELGEWKGIQLFWLDDFVHISGETTSVRAQHFKPGVSLVCTKPLETNALLTAYRRAVERKLATWPKGWEWAKDEIPDWFEPTRGVWLGERGDGNVGWITNSRIIYTDPNHQFRTGGTFACEDRKEGYCDHCHELRRRAALLGLCEAQPGACRRWGQCVSLAKAESQPCCGCANHEPDEPEPESVEERLRRELADMTKAKDVYRNQMFKNSEAYRKGGRMAYYTKAELIAMLQAKLGTHIGTDNKRFSPDLDLFAAKDAEIKQLKHELDRLGASIVKSGKELVEAGQEWLARNTP